MHVSSLELKNFKRFTDLTIDLSELAQPPKLVLLIGANGSGKSSVFDGFETLLSLKRSDGNNPSSSYHVKVPRTLYSVKMTTANQETLEFTIDDNNDIHSSEEIDPRNFYGRSSLRQVPRLTRTTLGQTKKVDFQKDTDRPYRYIDRDERFENDIEELVHRMLDKVFDNDDFNAQQFKEEYLQRINQSLYRIFGSLEASVLELVSLKPPMRGNVADIQFKKGTAQFHYDLLSSGEKEIINILFDLFVRSDTFKNTIYFIDELDLHLNTRLQYNLLKEITEEWIPDNCQLWTASHSYGFIDYARKADDAAIIDFGSRDYDVKQILQPESKNSFDVFNIAIPKGSILKLFDGKQIVLCENQNDRYYNLMELEGKLFFGVQNKDEVYIHVRKKGSDFDGLIDRDFLTEEELDFLRNEHKRLHILDYYCFENYLYHPANLKELDADFNTLAYINNITKQKNERKTMIASKIESARRRYAILKEENKFKYEKFDTITEALNSDELEVFYPFFSMKNFDKTMISSKIQNKNELVTTSWFKQKIAAVLA